MAGDPNPPKTRFRRAEGGGGGGEHVHRMRGIVGYVLFLLWRPFVRRPRGFIYVACRVGGGWLLYYKGHVLVWLTRKKSEVPEGSERLQDLPAACRIKGTAAGGLPDPL